MPSSNRGMSGRGNGTITVIEEPVMRSYRRKAKIVFYVTWVIRRPGRHRGRQQMAPDHRPARRPGLGFILGAAAGVIVAAWPVIRAIWWWTPETVITGGLVFGWIELADHTTLPIRLAATAAIVGIPAASSRSVPASTRSAGAWSPGTASGPAFPNSSSPTAPAACR